MVRDVAFVMVPGSRDRPQRPPRRVHVLGVPVVKGGELRGGSADDWTSRNSRRTQTALHDRPLVAVRMTAWLRRRRSGGDEGRRLPGGGMVDCRDRRAADVIRGVGGAGDKEVDRYSRRRPQLPTRCLCRSPEDGVRHRPGLTWVTDSDSSIWWGLAPD